MFFSKNSRKFATSPSPALDCYWLYKNYQPIGVTVHSHCVESFEGLLQRSRRGRGCSELWDCRFYIQDGPLSADIIFTCLERGINTGHPVDTQYDKWWPATEIQRYRLLLRIIGNLESRKSGQDIQAGQHILMWKVTIADLIGGSGFFLINGISAKSKY